MHALQARYQVLPKFIIQQGIKQAMEAAITATNSKLSQQAEIREKKVEQQENLNFVSDSCNDLVI